MFRNSALKAGPQCGRMARTANRPQPVPPVGPGREIYVWGSKRQQPRTCSGQPGRCKASSAAQLQKHPRPSFEWHGRGSQSLVGEAAAAGAGGLQPCFLRCILHCTSPISSIGAAAPVRATMDRPPGSIGLPLACMALSQGDLEPQGRPIGLPRTKCRISRGTPPALAPLPP